MSIISGGFESLAAVYEVSTVVTDIILNAEYIKRKWIEEYILSIVFLVFNGVIMGIVGVALDRKRRPCRFSNIGVINTLVGFAIGLLQLRVLVDTFWKFGTVVKHKNETEQFSSQRTQTTYAQQQLQEDREVHVKEIEDSLKYATFVQAIVRDAPIFVLQANATIHYRKWKFLDLWAVCSTFITLLHGVAAFITKQDKGIVKVAAFCFIVGQFVFRLGAILLVATTTGHIVIYYGIITLACSLFWAIKLELARGNSTWRGQVMTSVMLFPLFGFFVLDASKVTMHLGTARHALATKKLLPLHLWRFLENCIGVLLGVTQERYRDFGVSTDKEIATIGCICGAVFVVSFVLFHCVMSTTKDPMEEDTMLYLRNDTTMGAIQQPLQPHQYPPNNLYSMPQQEQVQQ